MTGKGLNGQAKIVYIVMTVVAGGVLGITTQQTNTQGTITEDRIQVILNLIAELDEEIDEVNDEIDKLQETFSNHEHSEGDTARDFILKEIDRLRDDLHELERDVHVHVPQ